MKKSRDKRIWMKTMPVIVAVIFSFLMTGCAGAGSPNIPYEPDTPPPEDHNGKFVSGHGTMTFNGDGSTVVLDLDSELAQMLGLPEGEQNGTYEFLSGPLAPGGSVGVRYDVAHELRLTVGDASTVVTVGLASEDGKNASVGTGIVTAEKIPLLFYEDGVNSNVIFIKE